MHKKNHIDYNSSRDGMTVHINEYLFSNQSRFVKGIGEVFSCVANLQLHLIIGLLLFFADIDDNDYDDDGIKCGKISK